MFEESDISVVSSGRRSNSCLILSSSSASVCFSPISRVSSSCSIAVYEQIFSAFLNVLVLVLNVLVHVDHKMFETSLPPEQQHVSVPFSGIFFSHYGVWQPIFCLFFLFAMFRSYFFFMDVAVWLYFLFLFTGVRLYVFFLWCTFFTWL